MNRRIVVAALVLIAGCQYEPGGRCDATSDCRAGERCTDGLCLAYENRAPTAAADAYSTTEDVALDVVAQAGVLANDVDPDGDPLTAVVVSPPAAGVLTLAPDGSFVYQPAADASGQVTFTYRSSDGAAVSSATTVTITIAPAPDAPIAIADSYVATGVTPLEVGAALGLLANDSDADGDPLTAVVVGGPAHGSLTLQPTGAFTYVAEAGFSGVDTFTYVATDGTLSSVAATVAVEVVAPPAPPVAVGDDYVATEDVPLVVTAAAGLLANDSDPNGDAITCEAVGAPAHGVLALAADGSFTYTPAANYNGPDAFTYRASDGTQYSSAVTVGLTVVAVPDAPVASPDAYGTDQGVAKVVPPAQGVLANDSDADGDVLTAVLVTPPVNGTLTLSADGGFTYVPTPAFTGADSFTYRAFDGALSSAVTAVSFTVTRVLPPTAPDAVADAYSVDEDCLLTVAAVNGPLSNDSDANGDPLGAVLGTSVAHGTLSFSADGSFTYLPDADFFGADQFTYKATDGLLESAETVVALTVAPVNDPPTAFGETYTGTEGQVLSVPAPGVLANDSDKEGDALRAELVSSVANGTLSLAADGSFSYTAFAGSRADSFTYRAVDALGEPSAPATVFLLSVPANRPPVAAWSGLETVVDTAASGQMVASDPDGDVLTYIIQDRPSHGTLAPDTATGAFTYTPSAGFVGYDAFTFYVTDGAAGSTVSRVAIEVLPSAGPAVSSLLPAVGGTGRPLQLHGSRFGSDPGTVTLGGRAATVVTWSDRRVVVTVPTDFEPGPKEVLLSTAASANAAPVSYDVRPWIDGIDPEVAAQGAPLTLSGDGFGAASGSVTVDGQAATIDSWTGTAVQIRVPAGVQGGPREVRLATAGGRASNVASITVPGSDVWIVPPVPAGRRHIQSVWTGTEVVTFGTDSPVGDGARYDPKTDRWRKMSIAGAPDARSYPAVAWTGEEVLVWGGLGYSSTPRGDGGRWNPVTDAWKPISMTGAPSPRYRHTSVWTGSELLVWGGIDQSWNPLRTGARYDPRTDTWRPMASVGAPPAASEAVGVWTGREWIIYGGYDGTNAVAGGYAYDPVADTWRPLPMDGWPYMRRSHSMVWTGSEVIVIGGSDTVATGGRYDPVTNTWRTTASPAFKRLRTHAAWMGKELFYVGGCRGTHSSCTLDGTWEAYDPETDSWRTVLYLSTQAVSYEGASVSTGSELILGFGHAEAFDAPSNVGNRLSLDGTFRRVIPAGSRPGRSFASMTWTGAEAVTFGGTTFMTADSNDGGRYDPLLDTWQDLPTALLPGARMGHTSTWVGDSVAIWGGDAAGPKLNTGRRWTPAANAWTTMSTTGAPQARSDHSAVWTGSELIVWGGLGETAPLDTGGRYRADLGTWSAMTTVGAPVARYGHAAAWTGTEMFVFGGESGTTLAPVLLRDGARYDPALDRWVPISVVGAPSVRMNATAVWTGSEIIVWGGNASFFLYDGARYDPATDSWRPMSAFGAPTGNNSAHHAVWTGTRMLVWVEWPGRGALYDPVTDTWSPMTTVGAPWGSHDRASVWTGEEFILWGGADAGREAAARYRP